MNTWRVIWAVLALADLRIGWGDTIPSSLTSALAHPTGEGARRAGEGYAFAHSNSSGADSDGAWGDPTTSDEPVATAPATAEIESDTECPWSFGVSAFAYIVPDSREYVQPTVTVDYDWLHLEARYNYEGLDSGSIWAGLNFGVGEKLAFEFTPMLGVVFGDTAGAALGYEASLSWWKLELYTEGEWLFDTRGMDDSFFYTWSELALSPCDWFRFGLAVQRTKLYESDFEVQRGFLVGFAYKWADLTTYVFNPDDDPTVVVAVGLSF